jgi:23S rRNA (guanine745-N1)-methyltransferase
MISPAQAHFQCPVCRSEAPDAILTWVHQSYRCAEGHCFDQAKAGYVNLLLSQHKKSKNPGDSDEMVKARHDFLNAGYYAPMAEALSQQVQTLSSASVPQYLLDMGCGEGYYLSYVRADGLQLSGVDIAKNAVHRAAKRKLGAQLAVASVFQLPFVAEQFDIALSVFSPLDPAETFRVLKPGGHLIMVGPGPEHLRGLMAYIYDDVQAHQGNPVLDTFLAEGLFTAVADHELKLNLVVQNEAIFPLLAMTPYYWKCDIPTQQRFQSMEQLHTPAHFTLKIYRKS